MPGASGAVFASAVFDASGRLYYCYKRSISPASSNIWIKVSDDGGATWGGAVAIAGTIGLAYLRPIIMTDQTNSPYKNYVYVTFIDAQNDPEQIHIRVARSTNRGVSFESPEFISGDQAGLFPEGPTLSIGPNGEMYAAWG